MIVHYNRYRSITKGYIPSSIRARFVGATPGAISGTAAFVFAGNGDLKGAGALIGTAPLVFAGSGTLLGAGVLVGAAALVFDGSGVLLDANSLVGTAVLVFGGSGKLTGAGVLQGSSHLYFSGSAASGRPPFRVDLAGSSLIIEQLVSELNIDLAES